MTRWERSRLSDRDRAHYLIGDDGQIQGMVCASLIPERGWLAESRGGACYCPTEDQARAWVEGSSK